MTVGNRLLEERTRLGLSQTALAAHAGIGKVTQLKYEKGTNHPDTDYLLKVAEQGVDIVYVLLGKRLSTEQETAAPNTPSDRALRFAQAFDALDAAHQLVIEQVCKMAVADATGVAIPPYLRKLPPPQPRPFPLRVDPYNRYASPDGIQPSPAQLELRSPAAMFLAEMYDAVPLGARDLVHSLCIKVLRDYEGLTESALIQWAERRSAARPESPERRAPIAAPVPDAALKK